MDLDQSVSRVLNSHFSKLYRVGAEFNVKAFSLSFYTEVEFVATIRTNSKVATGDVASSLGSVLNG